jgi:predicted nucleic acid-binding Zn ribbon protein
MEALRHGDSVEMVAKRFKVTIKTVLRAQEMTGSYPRLTERGNRWCGWCGEDLPEGSQRRTCSNDCANKLRSDLQLRRRDEELKGALVCACD